MKSFLGLVLLMVSASAQASQLQVYYHDFADNVSKKTYQITGYTAQGGEISVRAGENFDGSGASVILNQKVLRAAGLTVGTLISLIHSNAVIAVEEASNKSVKSVALDETLATSPASCSQK